jgi:quercetin dioxygenase-like cupin family protein
MQPGIERTDLQQVDLSVPGREVIQNKVVISPQAPPIMHTHPGEEIIYILAGTLEYQLQGQAPMTTHAGGAAELATYIVEKGKPLLAPA